MSGNLSFLVIEMAGSGRAPGGHPGLPRLGHSLRQGIPGTGTRRSANSRRVCFVWEFERRLPHRAARETGGRPAVFGAHRAGPLAIVTGPELPGVEHRCPRGWPTKRPSAWRRNRRRAGIRGADRRLSSGSPQVTGGSHVLIDVGAATLDVATFNVVLE